MRVSPAEVGELEIVLRDGNLELGRGMTEGGVLRFRGIGAGHYLLRCRESGAWQAQLAPGEEWRDAGGAWKTVNLPGDGQEFDAELRFVRSASLAGVVLDMNGTPLASVTVLAQSSERPAQTRSARTDEAGFFHMEGLSPARYDIAVPPSASHAAKERGLVLPRERILRPGQASWLELGFEPGRGRISGRVIDEYRQPVAGLRLVCSVPRAGGAPERLPDANRILARTRTDPGGSFQFEGLPATRLSVSVARRETALRANGRPRILKRAFAPREVYLQGETTSLGDLLVQRPAAFELAGHILVRNHPNSGGIPRLELLAEGGDQALAVPLVLDEQLAFHYRGELPTGSLTLRLSDGSGHVAHVRLTEGAPRAGARVYRELTWP